jgi:hypothetical protein
MLYFALQVQCVAYMVRETVDVDSELLIENMQQWKLES